MWIVLTAAVRDSSTRIRLYCHDVGSGRSGSRFLLPEGPPKLWGRGCTRRTFWQLAAGHGRLMLHLACSQDHAFTCKMARMGSGAPAAAPASDVQQMHLWALSPREMTQLEPSYGKMVPPATPYGKTVPLQTT